MKRYQSQSRGEQMSHQPDGGAMIDWTAHTDVDALRAEVRRLRVKLNMAEARAMRLDAEREQLRAVCESVSAQLSGFLELSEGGPVDDGES